MRKLVEIKTTAPPPIVIQKQKTIPQIKEKLKKFNLLVRGLPKAQRRYKKISKNLGVDLETWVKEQKDLPESDYRRKLCNYLKSVIGLPDKIKDYENQLKEREGDYTDTAPPPPPPPATPPPQV